MCLQRALQKGRLELSGPYTLGPPQAGHLTVRVGRVEELMTVGTSGQHLGRSRAVRELKLCVFIDRLQALRLSELHEAH